MSNMWNTLSKTYSVAKAILTGKDVGEDRLRERLKICSECELVKVQGQLMRCGICGCAVKESGLVNLARYEETDQYGCKYVDPKTKERYSKWKRAGV